MKPQDLTNPSKPRKTKLNGQKIWADEELAVGVEVQEMTTGGCLVDHETGNFEAEGSIYTIGTNEEGNSYISAIIPVENP